MLDVFRERGYSILTVPSAFTSAALLSSDVLIDHGYVNELEANLIARSPWASLFRREADAMLASAHRPQRLTHWTSQPRSRRPTRNAPVCFRPCLEPAYAIRPRRRGSERTAAPGTMLSRQLRRLVGDDGRNRDRLSRSIARPHARADSGPKRSACWARSTGSSKRIQTRIVVLMSDHGSRYTMADQQEHFKSFLAARAPGQDQLFPEDESDVNILRRIITAEFGVDLRASRIRGMVVGSRAARPHSASIRTDSVGGVGSIRQERESHRSRDDGRGPGVHRARLAAHRPVCATGAGLRTDVRRARILDRLGRRPVRHPVG